MNTRITHKKGFTLVELLVTMGIFSILSLGISWIFITSLRTNDVIWKQLSTQSDARKVLQEVKDSLRKAEQSDLGAYPIGAASSTGIIFFSNIDEDTNRERIRIWLSGTTVYRGIIHPSGNPLAYNAQEEAITEIAHYVINTAGGTPLFSYYNNTYTGENDPLEEPLDITEIRAIRIQLDVEENPGKSPVPFHAESLVHVRNLKDN